MERTSYFDFQTKEGLLAYQRKAKNNLSFFQRIFGGNPLEIASELRLQRPQGENKKLVEIICELTGLSQQEIEVINCGDEIINKLSILGCTAIGRNGVIGQTLDFYAVDLTVVKEDGALYITMPPYLTILGMNDKIALCTNHITSAVVEGGVPLSQVRRDILRCESLDEVIRYLKSTQRATSVNFLVTDGKDIADLEVTPNSVVVYEALEDNHGQYLAHTNHLLDVDIQKDASCPRLSKAVRLLQKNKPLIAILADSDIYRPIKPAIIFSKSYIGIERGGSIITAIMDPKKGVMHYKDPFMDSFETKSIKDS